MRSIERAQDFVVRFVCGTGTTVAVDVQRTEIATDEASRLIVLTGEWDLDNAADFRAVVDDFAAAGHEDVTIDMSETRFMDSVAIQALLHAAEIGMKVTVRGAHGSVLRALYMVGIDSFMALEP